MTLYRIKLVMEVFSAELPSSYKVHGTCLDDIKKWLSWLRSYSRMLMITDYETGELLAGWERGLGWTLIADELTSDKYVEREEDFRVGGKSPLDSAK